MTIKENTSKYIRSQWFSHIFRGWSISRQTIFLAQTLKLFPRKPAIEIHILSPYHLLPLHTPFQKRKGNTLFRSLKQRKTKAVRYTTQSSTLSTSLNQYKTISPQFSRNSLTNLGTGVKEYSFSWKRQKIYAKRIVTVTEHQNLGD